MKKILLFLFLMTTIALASNTSDRWVLIKNSIVQNVIVPPDIQDIEDYRNMITNQYDTIIDVNNDVRVGTGFSYVNGQFIEPTNENQ